MSNRAGPGFANQHGVEGAGLDKGSLRQLPRCSSRSRGDRPGQQKHSTRGQNHRIKAVVAVFLGPQAMMASSRPGCGQQRRKLYRRRSQSNYQLVATPNPGSNAHRRDPL